VPITIGFGPQTLLGVLGVAEIVAAESTTFPDHLQLGDRLPYGVAVAGVLVRLAELTALPSPRRGSSHFDRLW